MGIDVYLLWEGQTETERDAQCTGFSTQHGHVGYLREAYHGGPYATRALVPEAFAAEGEDRENGTPTPAATMRGRLPMVIALAKERCRTLYNGSDAEQEQDAQAFSDFVELAERKEQETGHPCRVIASY